MPTDPTRPAARGGPRPGAGRPRLHDDPVVSVTVALTPTHLAALNALAAERGITRTALARDVLSRYLTRVKRAK